MSPYYQHLRERVGNDLLLVPAVAAIIHDPEGRLLLVEKHDGSWSLPAGAIEPGQTPEAALVAEIREETGLLCQSSKLMAVVGGEEYRHTYPNGDRVEYTVALYWCTTSGSFSPLDTTEVKSLRSFAREDFPGLTLPYDLALLYNPRNPQSGTDK